MLMAEKNKELAQFPTSARGESQRRGLNLYPVKLWQRSFGVQLEVELEPAPPDVPSGEAGPEMRFY